MPATIVFLLVSAFISILSPAQAVHVNIDDEINKKYNQGCYARKADLFGHFITSLLDKIRFY